MGQDKRNNLILVSLVKAVEDMKLRGKVAEALIRAQRPELLSLFITYQNEAVASREYLESSLLEISEGAEILEVGGGVLALTIQLASEGYRLTTVEPVGEGFAEIEFIMGIFLDIAKKENLDFNLLQFPIEDCEFNRKFDFVFSINVMEHLKDPFSVILRMVEVLTPKGKYRFFCPNYDFPYEPHFAKWLLIRRRDSFFLQERRAKSKLINEDHAKGLYNSLNFITLNKVIKFSRLKEIQIQPNRDAFFNLLNRVTRDQELSGRHGILSSFAKVIVFLKIHYISKLVPVQIQPIIDCELTNSAN